MKVCGQKMEVTLSVHGRERTFSEEELIAILEKNISSEPTKQVTTAKVVRKPTEDEWFEVNLQAIDQKLFQKKREDSRQEKTRKLILEAFVKVSTNPERYGRAFKTMMPKKTWSSKTSAELKKVACKLGNHNADWVEQALEWAQRIANGETWEDICNNRDTANYYRLVVWKNGYVRLVGGSCNSFSNYPASDVNDDNFNDDDIFDFTVPLVVRYK